MVKALVSYAAREWRRRIVARCRPSDRAGDRSRLPLRPTSWPYPAS